MNLNKITKRIFLAILIIYPIMFFSLAFLMYKWTSGHPEIADIYYNNEPLMHVWVLPAAFGMIWIKATIFGYLAFAWDARFRGE